MKYLPLQYMASEQKYHHFILNKPYNCLSQFIYEGKRKNHKVRSKKVEKGYYLIIFA